MKTLKNWTAKRAGGRITVYGVDVETGEPLRVVGVDHIKASRLGVYNTPIATDKNGAQYALVS